MKTGKYYFENPESENCFTIDYFYELMEDNDLSEMQIYPAKMVKSEGYFWCNEFDEIGETGESCGKLNCDKYVPRNGKNGRCKQHRNCYEPSEISIKITLK